MDVLYVHAAPAEAGDFAGDLPRVLQLGVGKSLAGATLARELAMRPASLVVAFGVAGVTPARLAGSDPPSLSVGEVCLVRTDRLGDEGVETPKGFLDLPTLGLRDARPAHTTGVWSWDAARGPALAKSLGLPIVDGLTVSTCSGTDTLARERFERTHAPIETMEGAAIAIACAQASVPWIAIRAISNETGDRDRAGWDLGAAIDALRPKLLRLRDVVSD